MTTTRPDPHSDEQLELMTSLLEGAEPDAYVVAPLSEVLSLLSRALFLTRDTHGAHRPGRASVRLVQLLEAQGHLVNTRYEPPS